MPFVFDGLYAFRNELPHVAPPRKLTIPNSWILPSLNEMSWFAFLMTVGSMSCSLTARGGKLDLIKLRSHFALLKPNACKTMQQRSRGFWKSNIWYLCIWKTWVEAQMSLSPSSWLMSNFLACSRRLWRCVSLSKTLPSLILIVVLISRNRSFLCVLLCDASSSSAPIKDATSWWEMLCFRRVSVDLFLRYQKSPACQGEFLGIDILSSDGYVLLCHCV